MTRNQRIQQYAGEIRCHMANHRRWVNVTVAPGHECTAPFTTLSPRDSDTIIELLQKISAETRGERTTP